MIFLISLVNITWIRITYINKVPELENIFFGNEMDLLMMVYMGINLFKSAPD
jgi:hypothetical protein